MFVVIWGVLVAAVVLGGLIWFRRQSGDVPAPRSPLQAPAVPVALESKKPDAVNTTQPVARPSVVRSAVMPAALKEFNWVEAQALPEPNRQALLERLRVIPRPPHALYKLLSQEFLTSATSLELSELIKGESVIAAKVLAAVNSPMYGLQKTVASLGQAVTFLGLNTVRALCTQYMLGASFKADGAEQQKVFDRIWRASAEASNLCAKLGQKLAVANQGALVTQVVLYFLGQLATYALLPKDVASRLRSSASLLERMRVEQEQLGLNASEVGALLMAEWNLPDSIIADVRDIDRVLDTPAAGFDVARGERLALCYLCARWGEDVSAGRPLEDLKATLHANEQPEFWYLQDYLSHPGLVRLPEVLDSLV